MGRTRKGRGPLARARGAARQILALMVLAGSLLLAAAFVGVTAPSNALAREKDALTAEIARLDADLAAKQAQLAQKQTDAYVIGKARDQGYVRPGEALVTVQGVDAKRPAAGGEQGPGRLAKWWAVFFR
ncbi:MAG TPA: hypothetical protein VFM93_01115 [Candidatus Limnocylindria bacterium]|nr:hypothetical protein [Candidatus Limnocylindria bacterium]